MMGVWRIQGWFHDPNAERPSEHVLTVGAHTMDSAIDLAVAKWNNSRVDLHQVIRQNVYGVSKMMTMDAVESEEE